MIAAIVLAVAGFGALIWATNRAINRVGKRGRHERLFADPRDVTDPDGSQFLRELHHDDWPARLGLAGCLPMLPPDPPPDDTAPLPVAVCELGMPTTEYVDALFEKYAEVTA